MLSKYFKIKTKSDEFKKRIRDLSETLQNKKVLIYGAGEGFVELNKQYDFNKIMNVVAVADIKFETETLYENFRAINPNNIINENFDVIILTNETTWRIVTYIESTLKIKNKQIIPLFETNIPDEVENINYLEKFNFSKQLEKLKRKLKKKSIVIYGAGTFFQTIKQYYNFSDINIIGICDRKFVKGNNTEFLGYKTYSIQEVNELKPDYILVATKMYVPIMEDLYFNSMRNTKIKPLLKKDIWTLIGEIWST